MGVLRRKTASATPEVSSVSASPQSKPRSAAGAGTPKSLPSLDEVPAERRKTTAFAPGGTGRSLLPASGQIRGTGEEGLPPTATAAVSSSASSFPQSTRLTALSQQRRKTTAGLLSPRGAVGASTAVAHASSDLALAKAGGGLLARGRGKSVMVTGSTPSTSTASTAASTMTKARRPTRVSGTPPTPAVGHGVKAVKKADEKEEETGEPQSPGEAEGKGRARTRTSVEIVGDIKSMIRNRLEQEQKHAKEAEEASSSKHYDVSDLPLPIRRGQPRVQIPAGPFPPIRDAPELEVSFLLFF